VGTTGGKKAKGRKRFILVDSLGLIWALWVTTADVQDRDGGRWLLSQFRHLLPRVREIIADSGFSKRFVEWVRRACGWTVTTTATAGKGFEVHPRRWVVERTFGWLVSYRRLGKDYERLTETSEAMIRVAMIHLMLRRLKPLP
jgi:putative transposase